MTNPLNTINRLMRKAYWVQVRLVCSFSILVSLLLVWTVAPVSSESLDLELSMGVEGTEVPEKVPGSDIEERVFMLTLGDAIRMGLSFNRPFQNFKDSLIQSRFNLRNAESVFETKLTPSFTEDISGNGTVGTVDIYNLSLDKRINTGADLSLSFNTFADDEAIVPYNSNFTVSLRQPLLRDAWPLVATASLVDARSALLIQEFSLESSRQQLILNVISAYYGLLNQMELVEINKKSVERVENFLRATIARKDIGRATLLDVARAEIQLSTQRQALLRTIRTMEDQEDSMKVLLGLRLGDNIELVEKVADFEPMEIDLREAMEIADKSRPELKRAKVRLKDVERRSRISWREQLPRVDLSGTYIKSSSADSFSRSWDLEQNEWIVGLTASYTFPATSERVGYEQSKISLRQEKRSLEELRDNIIREVKVAARAVNETRARIAIVRKEVEQAEKRLKLATLRFEKGLGDNLDVILAEEDILRAENNLSSAIAEHLIAQYRLKLTMGILDVEQAAAGEN